MSSNTWVLEKQLEYWAPKRQRWFAKPLKLHIPLIGTQMLKLPKKLHFSADLAIGMSQGVNVNPCQTDEIDVNYPYSVIMEKSAQRV